MQQPFSTDFLKQLPIGFTFSAYVETPSMEPTIHVRDIIQAVRIQGKDVKRGDVIMYGHKNYSKPVIHRVVGIHRNGDVFSFSTKGDATQKKDRYLTREGDIIARVVLLKTDHGTFLDYVKKFFKR